MNSISIYDKDGSDFDVESAMQVIEKQVELPAGIKKRLSKVCGSFGGDAPKIFPPSRLVELDEIVSKMLTRIVDGDNEFLSTATLRDISSTVGAMISLLRLFDSSQKKIDHAKEVDELFNAVMASISCLTPSQQKPFFDSLSDPKWGMQAPKFDGGADNE